MHLVLHGYAEVDSMPATWRTAMIGFGDTIEKNVPTVRKTSTMRRIRNLGDDSYCNE